MSRKKATPARARRATAREGTATGPFDLTSALAAILSHPDTPDEICDGIHDGLTEIFNSAARDGGQAGIVNSPGYIPAILRAREGKGGAK